MRGRFRSCSGILVTEAIKNFGSEGFDVLLVRGMERQVGQEGSAERPKNLEF
jgi:hypothetical protein